jgi:hypothetical protein
MAARRLMSAAMLSSLACATDANHVCETIPGNSPQSTAGLARHTIFGRDCYCLLWRILLWSALYTPSWVHAQQPTEYQVKATYLYNFSQFVQWPPQATAASNSFDICILGQDPFGSTLNSILANESIAGKRVAARRISSSQDAVNCRVLFISSSEGGRLKEILNALGGASVLTVSDLPQFTVHGGMLQFLLMDDRVRFEVNLAAAERAGLSLSSELLKVAINVRRTNSPGD